VRPVSVHEVTAPRFAQPPLVTMSVFALLDPRKTR